MSEAQGPQPPHWCGVVRGRLFVAFLCSFRCRVFGRSLGFVGSTFVTRFRFWF